jgi:PAS domain S-box-containing protein
MLDLSEIMTARILIVDNQEVNISLLEQMLRGAGYSHITSTQDSRMVCPMHVMDRYDLILLDLDMPGEDGFEALECLKQIESGNYFPVLVITANLDLRLRALQSGVRDFISKPLNPIEVQARLHNMLEARLLHQRLENWNKALEQKVMEYTAELRESEARFRSFTELSTDWYWEQDKNGKFTQVSGPVFEMLGIEMDNVLNLHCTDKSGSWDSAERAQLSDNIAARRPFLDFIYTRNNPDGTRQYFQVSGQPVFDETSRFTGYRGVGVDITPSIQAKRA